MKRIVFVWIFFLVWNNSIAQQNTYTPKIIPPSPNAASLGKYGEIPVSNYTGIPSISIPIYTIQAGELSQNINISYHASGIRVSEEASRVGLGWALNAGGVVSRNIMGEDDFEALTYFNSLELPRGNASRPAELVSISSGFVARFTSQNLDLTSAIRDGNSPEFEPDIYNFNIGGVSGKFVITRTKQVILEKKGNIKVEMIEGTPTGNYGANIKWKITDGTGNTYYFDQLETSVDGNSKFHVNSWYITKIVSSKGDQITFNYIQESNKRVYTQGSISETKVGAVLSASICPASASAATYLPPNRAPSVNYSLVYLSEIVFPNGKVVFNYNPDTDPRQDVGGDKRLDEIAIYQKQSSSYVLLKSHVFAYSYFDGAGDIDYPAAPEGSVSKRLKLLSVTEKVGTTTLPGHSFTYYEGDSYTNLPAKTSFAIDHWGYFNGRITNTSLIPSYTAYPSDDPIVYNTGVPTGQERTSNPEYVRAFSLKRITYPTGGYTDFDFEANDYDINLSMIRDQSAFGSKELLDIIPKTYSLFYNTSQKNVLQSLDFNITDAIAIKNLTSIKLTAFARLPFSESNPSCGYGPTGTVYFSIINKITGQTVFNQLDMFNAYTCTGTQTDGCAKWGCSSSGAAQNVEYNSTIDLQPGQYTIKAYVASNSTYNIMDFLFTIRYNAQLSKSSTARGYCGGLRIKTMKHFDGTNLTQTNYKYELMDTTAIKRSAGIRMAAPQYSYWEEVGDFQSSSSCNGIYLTLKRSSNSIFTLNKSASGSIVGYSVVQVEQISGSTTNGKSIYYYHNKPDYVNYYGYYKTPNNATDPDERNGNLLKEEIYNTSGQKLKEVTYDYSYDLAPVQIWGLEKRPHSYQGGLIIFYDDFFYYQSLKSSTSNLISKKETVFSY